MAHAICARSGLPAFTIVLAAALLCPGALAQEQFTLTEDDAWTKTSEPDPSTPQGQLELARQALARNDAPRAQEMATQWIDSHERDPLLPEAYLLRADTKMTLGNYYDALFDYEFVARVYPGSDAFITALQHEYEIARKFATGTKRKLWGMRLLNATDTAEELLIRIQERLGGSRLAEQAGMTLADLYFDRGDMTLAAEAYQLFVENYPRSEQIERARRRLIAAYWAQFKGPEFDPEGLYEARSRLLEMKKFDAAAAEQIGADALLTRIDESDAVKMLATARWYLKTNDYISAEFMIRSLVQKYPHSVATTDSLRLIPEVLKHLPANILKQAPNYEAYRNAILGAATSKQAEAEPPPAHPDAGPMVRSTSSEQRP